MPTQKGRRVGAPSGRCGVRQLGRWKKEANKSQLGGKETANVCFMTQIISVFVFPFAREMSYCTVFIQGGRG